jgi:hypothetical protein
LNLRPSGYEPEPRANRGDGRRLPVAGRMAHLSRLLSGARRSLRCGEALGEAQNATFSIILLHGLPFVALRCTPCDRSGCRRWC